MSMAQTTKPSNLVHLAHVVICFATMGFVFPGALMEQIEADKSIAREAARRAAAVDGPPTS